MPQNAANDLTIDNAEYAATRDYWWPDGVLKVTLDVGGAAVLVQFSEAPERSHYPEPAANTEQKIKPGVRSRVFATPVYSMRVREATAGSPATLSYVTDA